MNNFFPVYKRELRGYFNSPVAYVFITVFLIATAGCTFYLGRFYESMQADLSAFFVWHPWLYLFLIPAIGMRLWSEERKSGSIELLLTLPIQLWETVLAKFFAGWVFTGCALLGTVPLWLTVSYLGEPDHGVILSSYLGSWMMAGAFLAIGGCMSALTKSQIIAFIVTGSVCLLFVLAGFPLVLNFFNGWVAQWILDTVAGLSVLNHFVAITRGVVSLEDALYFVSMMALWLYLTVLALEAKRAE